ncbi:MAG: TonB family protein, partial [Betaproteobacteria bacterium]|nr:TonB family protein [Betaproteobacteria bacterium]
ASGNPISATLKASSGHALLDDAAVRAARALRALPESMPRETLLPVRFRLR